MNDKDVKINYIIELNNQRNLEITVKKNRKKEYDKDRYERLHGYTKNKDDSIECDICGGYWKVDNKHRHINTMKHQKAYAIFIKNNYKY